MLRVRIVGLWRAVLGARFGCGLFWLLASGFPFCALADSPFKLDARLEKTNDSLFVRLAFSIPEGHYLYADDLEVVATNHVTLAPFAVPEPMTIQDKFLNEPKRVYDRSFTLVYQVGDPRRRKPIDLRVAFQGCNQEVCFFPETRAFKLSLGGGMAESSSAPSAPAGGGVRQPEDWRLLVGQFTLSARGAGYMNPADFLAFLDRGAGGAGPGAPAADANAAADWTGWLSVLLIILGGAALNLTPCVLPLIPVNLAIIGAGAKAGSPLRGFALGGLYGAGMALAYGGLGLLVVLTGARFGALNASPWFNAAIAALFVVLALGMFDVVRIDFSRFQGAVRTDRSGGGVGRYFAVFGMGVVAAVLAGACVAPMVISVLLLAGNLYSKGVLVGLFLPFLLGFGMGLPWPFAGAGLSFLPKPGRWMNWIKYLFGVVIVLLAVYYADLAWRLFKTERLTPAGVVTSSQSDRELVEALNLSLEQGTPVLIDFWATWCKNCLAMDETTFKDPAVRRRLEEFIFVKYQAETPGKSPAREILDYFGAIGLPTYVVLTPSD